MGKAYTAGLTEECMMVNMLMIKNTVSEFINGTQNPPHFLGPMAASMKENGKTENSMGKENTN